MSNAKPQSRPRLRRAFRRGMLIALGIAFVPVAVVSTALFLSGYQPEDFNPGLRYVLIVLWLLYVFTADRIASFGFWHRIPFMRGANKGELITVFVFAAIVASLRLSSGSALHWMIVDWLINFLAMSALFLVLYVLFRAVTRSWRRARDRVRSRVVHDKHASG